MEIYTTKQAAAYLGITPHKLRAYLYGVTPAGTAEPVLRADGKHGNALKFKRTTLDAFRDVYLEPAGVTLEEAQAITGLSRNNLLGKLTPVGRRGQYNIYRREDVEALKK